MLNKLDNTIYANDAFAQMLLANTATIAAENTTDPVSICPLYWLLEPVVLSDFVSAVVGPAGTGKSVAVALLAHRLGIPLIIFQATKETRAASLFGRLVSNPNEGVNGDRRRFIFEKGLLLQAYEKGYWFDCEEYLQFAPSQQSLLMKILDKSAKSFCVEDTKEIIQRHPNFRFIGTGNPDYHGNKEEQQNEAYIDRFSSVLDIPALERQGVASECSERYPRYKNTGFFRVAFDLNNALDTSTSQNLRKNLVFGVRRINACCQLLEYVESFANSSISPEIFKSVVKTTFGGPISQTGGGSKCLPAIFDSESISGHVNKMYDEYKKTLTTTAPAGKGAATAPAAQPASSDEDSSRPENVFDAAMKKGGYYRL